MSNPKSAPKVAPAPTPAPIPAPVPAPAPFRHALGGIKEQMVLASTVPAVNFKAVLTDLPGNPFLYQRRVAQNLLPANPNITVTPDLVNTLSGQPLTTNVADKIEDVTEDSA